MGAGAFSGNVTVLCGLIMPHGHEVSQMSQITGNTAVDKTATRRSIINTNIVNLFCAIVCSVESQHLFLFSASVEKSAGAVASKWTCCATVLSTVEIMNG